MERQLCEAHKLHDSLILVKQEQHRKEFDDFQNSKEFEISKLSETIKRQEIELASVKQEMKMTYCRKRSHDKHEANLKISNLKENLETLKMKIRTAELNIAQKENFIHDLEDQILKLEENLEILESKLNLAQATVQENQIIHQEYVSQGKYLGKRLFIFF